MKYRKIGYSSAQNLKVSKRGRETRGEGVVIKGDAGGEVRACNVRNGQKN